MSDTETVDPGTTTEQAEAVKAMEPAEKPAKIVAQPHACLCQTFELVDPKDPETVYQTECGQTTKSVFAQGHDARLVSFLVDGHFDGYAIRQTVNGVGTSFATPADAVASISTPLHTKAVKATENREAKQAAKETATKEREAKKAERKAEAEKRAADKAAAKEAAKAAGPKATGAEVVAGSREGELPELAEGQALIKVGKFDYVADVDADGTATYTDGSGAEQVRERDGYQLLKSYEG